MKLIGTEIYYIKYIKCFVPANAKKQIATRSIQKLYPGDSVRYIEAGFDLATRKKFMMFRVESPLP